MGLGWHLEVKIGNRYKEVKTTPDDSCKLGKASKEIHTHFKTPKTWVGNEDDGDTKYHYQCISNFIFLALGKSLGAMFYWYGREEWQTECFGEKDGNVITKETAKKLLGYIAVLNFFGIPELQEREPEQYKQHVKDLYAHKYVLEKYLSYDGPYEIRIATSY